MHAGRRRGEVSERRERCERRRRRRGHGQTQATKSSQVKSSLYGVRSRVDQSSPPERNPCIRRIGLGISLQDAAEKPEHRLLQSPASQKTPIIDGLSGPNCEVHRGRIDRDRGDTPAANSAVWCGAVGGGWSRRACVSIFGICICICICICASAHLRITAPDGRPDGPNRSSRSSRLRSRGGLDVWIRHNAFATRELRDIPRKKGTAVSYPALPVGRQGTTCYSVLRTP